MRKINNFLISTLLILSLSIPVFIFPTMQTNNLILNKKGILYDPATFNQIGEIEATVLDKFSVYQVNLTGQLYEPFTIIFEMQKREYLNMLLDNGTSVPMLRDYINTTITFKGNIFDIIKSTTITCFYDFNIGEKSYINGIIGVLGICFAIPGFNKDDLNLNLSAKDSSSLNLEQSNSDSNSGEIMDMDSGEEWLSGWSYRKRHIITSSSGADCNYTVMFRVYKDYGIDDSENVYCNFNCRDDFGDIRFTKSDGITELSYWIESINSGNNAIFWVKIPGNLSTSDVHIYLYYGKPDSPVNATNGEDFFIFFDDFESGIVSSNKWIANGNDTDNKIEVVTFDGSYRCHVFEEGDNVRTNLYTQNWVASGSVAIHVDWRRQQNKYYWAYWMYGGVRKVDGVYCISESVYYYPTNANPHKSYTGSSYQPYQNGGVSSTLQTWYEFVYKCTSDKFVLQVNGIDHEGYYRSDTGGYGEPRGFEPLTAAQKEVNREVYFDNVFVRNYVDPEPQHGAWSIQQHNSSVWLSGWTFRKGHVINSASGAGTNYQVKITVYKDSGTDSSGDSVHCNKYCKDDFSDIRFTSSDGVTQLSYWRESYTSGDNAVFWVKITDDLSSNKVKIYIYYNNPEATTTSNPSSTMIAWDDFDTGYTSGDSPKSARGWSSAYKSANDILQVTSRPGGSGLALKYKEDADGVLPMELRNTFMQTSMILAHFDYNWYSRQSRCIFEFKDGNDNYPWIKSKADGSPWEQKWVNGGGTPNSYTPQHYVSANSWYTYEFICLTDDHKLVELVPHIETHSGDVLYEGSGYNRFELSADNDYADEIYIDNFYVRKYVSPEPTHGVWGFEEASTFANTKVWLSSGDNNEIKGGIFTYAMSEHGWIGRYESPAVSRWYTSFWVNSNYNPMGVTEYVEYFEMELWDNYEYPNQRFSLSNQDPRPNEGTVYINFGASGGLGLSTGIFSIGFGLGINFNAPNVDITGTNSTFLKWTFVWLHDPYWPPTETLDLYKDSSKALGTQTDVSVLSGIDLEAHSCKMKTRLWWSYFSPGYGWVFQSTAWLNVDFNIDLY